jgi:DNA-binding NtrC family response regulator
VSDLRVLALTDSFHAEWPALARAHGLTLATYDEPSELEPAAGSITLIAAGGAEQSLESVLRRLPTGNRFLAAAGAEANHRLAAAAVRAGADDYFALPADVDALRSWVADAVARIEQEREAASFAERERDGVQFDGILGTSAALHAALTRARRVIGRPTVTVLLTGETGTGKELLARAIHYNGPRRDAPFVDVNCAAIPENLLESELFGHEKGAFTSATATKPGLMQLADGGTLFLDEIGHLPLPLQGKVLRALEERTIRRVGGTRSIPFDVRLIAAITQAAAQRMLELCNGNKSVTARRLGISRPRLQRLLDATLDQLERDDEVSDE